VKSRIPVDNAIVLTGCCVEFG